MNQPTICQNIFEVCESTACPMTIAEPRGGDLEVVFVNSAAAELLGYAAEKLLTYREADPEGGPFDSDGRPLSPAESPLWRAWQSAAPQHWLLRFRAPDGARWFEGECRPVVLGQGVAYLVSTFRELSLAEAASCTASSAINGVYLHGPDGRIIYASPDVERVLGYNASEAVGRSLVEFLYPGDREQVLRLMERLTMEPSRTVSARVRVRHKNGTWRTLEGSATNMLSHSSVGAIMGRYRDVTAHTDRQPPRISFRAAIEQAREAVCFLGLDNRLTYVNQRLCRLLDYSSQELLQLTFFDLVKEAPYGRPIVPPNRDGWQRELRLARRDGKTLWGLCSINPMIDESDHRTGMVVMISDISRRKQAENRLTRKALYDQLTTLPNRGLLEDRGGEAIRRAKRHGGDVTVAVLDLDGFKSVNDTLGHSFGDELLREFAARLRRCVRGSDTVARTGGDEFALLLPDCGGGSAVAKKVLQGLREPFVLDGQPYSLGCSIGLASYPEHALDFAELLHGADLAMYRAKRHRLGWTTFHASQDAA